MTKVEIGELPTRIKITNLGPDSLDVLKYISTNEPCPLTSLVIQKFDEKYFNSLIDRGFIDLSENSSSLFYVLNSSRREEIQKYFLEESI